MCDVCCVVGDLCYVMCERFLPVPLHMCCLQVFRQIAYDHEVVRRSSYTPLATVRERPRLGMSSLNSRHFQSLCEGPAAFNTAFNTPRPPRFISPPASPPSRHCRTHREPLCSEQLHVLMRDSSEEEEEEEEGEGEGYPSQASLIPHTVPHHFISTGPRPAL